MRSTPGLVQKPHDGSHLAPVSTTLHLEEEEEKGNVQKLGSSQKRNGARKNSFFSWARSSCARPGRRTKRCAGPMELCPGQSSAAFGSQIRNSHTHVTHYTCLAGCACADASIILARARAGARAAWGRRKHIFQGVFAHGPKQRVQPVHLLLQDPLSSISSSNSITLRFFLPSLLGNCKQSSG